MYALSAALFVPYSVTASGSGTPPCKAVCTSARTLRPRELALSSIYACIRAAMLSLSVLSCSERSVSFSASTASR